MAEYASKLNEFYFLLGESLRYCQQVEHDVQMILALMQDGDKHDNLSSIKSERMTLGGTIHALGEIDASREKPFFSPRDYKVLYSMTGERNHFVHQSFNEFLYRQGEAGEVAFNVEFERLKKFHSNMKLVSSDALKARLEAARRVLKA